jgi:hypothetical protein
MGTEPDRCCADSLESPKVEAPRVRREATMKALDWRQVSCLLGCGLCKADSGTPYPGWLGYSHSVSQSSDILSPLAAGLPMEWGSGRTQM